MHPSPSLVEQFVAVSDASNPMAGVTRDATSGKYFPSTLDEWTTTLAAAGISSGNPSAIFLMQDASGGAVDVTGTFNLTAGGTPTYQQAVAGYTRLGILFDNNTTDALSTSSASLPDLTSASQFVLLVARVPSAAPAAFRTFCALGGSGTRFSATINGTPRMESRHAANVATGTVAAADGLVHVIALRHNDTASEVDVMTESEKLSPTFSVTVAGKGLLFGNSSATAPNMTLMYAASFHGAAAELTDAQIKTLLQTLGWTVGW